MLLDRLRKFLDDRGTLDVLVYVNNVLKGKLLKSGILVQQASSSSPIRPTSPMKS